MVKVLVAAPIHPDAIKMLKDAGFEVIYEEYPNVERLKELIRDVDAVIVRSKPKVPAEVIEAGSRLRIIARAGVGLDNIDLETARKRNIKVVNAPKAPMRSVAELVFGLALALLRKIAYADRKMREGEWVKKRCLGVELHGKTIGIIGFGRIGREVARIAKHGFGMKVMYYDVVRAPKEVEEELGAVKADLNEILRNADVVTLHVPLLETTRHMINEERLKIMKKSAILVNTSRGAVVDTEALVKALKEGWIAGAALDVFEEEPLPKEHPLTKLDNVVLTPHIGASTEEAQRRAGIEVVRQIIEYLKSS